MQVHSSFDRINHVKDAIVLSNIVTTISPTYAQALRTSQLGVFTGFSSGFGFSGQVVLVFV
uniref:Putative starch synthase, catalytic domain-containing protein n=1 Tax=Helianthus annuus TaxID=4232 RepID=A0A251T6R8_HELAN